MDKDITLDFTFETGDTGMQSRGGICLSDIMRNLPIQVADSIRA
jgi:hypothetical protein